MNVIESINVADAKTGLSPVDVLLVITPFCDEYLPDLTFAMFKAALRAAGVASRVQHEYLYFAKRIGAEYYDGGEHSNMLPRATIIKLTRMHNMLERAIRARWTQMAVPSRLYIVG